MSNIGTEESAGISGIDGLVALFDDSVDWPIVPIESRDGARRRALEVLYAGPDSEGAAALAQLRFAAEMLVAVAVDLAANPSLGNRLIDQIEEVASVRRVALGCEVLRDPHLLKLPTAVAIEVELALLQLFSEVTAVSLWTLLPDGELKHLFHAGEFDVNYRQTRLVVHELLGGAAARGKHRDAIVGVTIDGWQRMAAALVVRGEPRRSDHRTALVEAAVPVLGAMLERDERLTRENWSKPSGTAAIERRLARLRFDLHDGPQQDVVLLADDLRLFRDQLRPIVEGDPSADRILGRLDDLGAQLVALDGDLRRIVSMVQSPFLEHGSLAEALMQITGAFAERTGIQPEISLEGDLMGLTDSQHITLLSLVREALSNVREHSEASRVTIKISAHAKGLEAEVTDDGRGFSPEATLVRAARQGHLGLVGIHERVRMLGGRSRIESKPGGPTVIAVSLPPRPPIEPSRTG